MCPEFGRAPHRDHGERLPVGEVDPLHAQHPVDAEHLRDPLGCRLVGELLDLAFRQLADALDVGLDRGQRRQGLSDGLGGDEPPEPLPRGDQPVLAHEFQCPPDCHSGGAELRGHLGLRRQDRPGRRVERASAQLVGDLLITDVSHDVSRRPGGCVIDWLRGGQLVL
jgi:hypothetical protein